MIVLLLGGLVLATAAQAGEKYKGYVRGELFITPQELNQYFYCQSGVRCTNWMSTLYALGWPMERLYNYDGSWIAWSKDETLSIEKGCPDATPASWQKK